MIFAGDSKWLLWLAALISAGFMFGCGGGSSGGGGAGQEAGPPLSVLSTSYANFKEVGIGVTAIPNGTWPRAYGDFYQDGRRSLFTARQTYDQTKSFAEATSARYEFWRFVNGSWSLDNSILTPPVSTCIHPRQVLVADFNADAKPDIFIACHGYDMPPWPGERNHVLLSSAAGTYIVYDASADVGYWHGAAAGDINRDGKVDVVLVDGNRPLLYTNDGAGQFALEPGDRFASIVPLAPWWTVQITDVNQDALLDVMIGGSAWATCPGVVPVQTCSNPATATVLLGTASGEFTAETLPDVPGEGLILDFVVTGSGATRTVWVNRTSGSTSTTVPAYTGRTLQRIVWNGLQSTVAYTNRNEKWILWLMPMTIGGSAFIASDDANDQFVPVRVP